MSLYGADIAIFRCVASSEHIVVKQKNHVYMYKAVTREKTVTTNNNQELVCVTGPVVTNGIQEFVRNEKLR